MSNVATFERHTFTDADIVNIDNWIPAGEYNPHNVRPWLIYHAFGTVAVVFAECEQDAFDEAIDAGKLDSSMVEGGYCNLEECPHLTGGNAGQCFVQDDLGLIPLPNIPMAWASMFMVAVKS